jgi:hypothetical protein
MGAFFCGATGNGPGYMIYFCEFSLWAPMFILLLMFWSVCKVLLNLHSLPPSEIPSSEVTDQPKGLTLLRSSPTAEEDYGTRTAGLARRLMAVPARIRHGYYEGLEEEDRKELRVQAWWLSITLTIYVLIFLKFEILR